MFKSNSKVGYVLVANDESPGGSFALPAGLRLGVEAIDFEHDNIFRQIMSLMQSATSLSRQELERQVRRIHLCFEDHFSREESAMAKVGYPGIRAHVEAHQRYLGVLADLLGTLTGTDAQGQAPITMLDQLIREAIEADMEYASWLKNSGLRHPEQSRPAPK